MSLPGAYNLLIYQGQTFDLDLTWTAGNCCGQGTVGSGQQPVDLTGYTATMQFRPFAGAAQLYYDASGNIILGGALGTIDLSIPASATEGFTWWSGVYDLLLTDSTGNVTPLLAGNVQITASVST